MCESGCWTRFGRPLNPFEPEFLNRVDDIIVFNTLSKEHLAVIIDLQPARVGKMLTDRGLKLEAAGDFPGLCCVLQKVKKLTTLK